MADRDARTDIALSASTSRRTQVRSRGNGRFPPELFLIHVHEPEGENSVKLSARNQFKGKIVNVTKGATTSHVRIEIGQNVIVTASITNEAVAELGLQKGDDAWAVIKASDVMIGKE